MSKFFYAELNEYNTCINILRNQSEKQFGNSVIPIKEYDKTLIGKTYLQNSESWVDKDQIEQTTIRICKPSYDEIIEPTQLDRIEIMLIKLLQNNYDLIIDNYTMELIERKIL